MYGQTLYDLVNAELMSVKETLMGITIGGTFKPSRTKPDYRIAFGN